MAAIKVIVQSQVSPQPASVDEASLPLSFFDLIWLHADPVERIFLFPFPHSTSHFISATLSAIKSSLSLALFRFFPLAGRIRRSPADSDQFEIHYVDGDSVSFTVAELVDGAHFADLVGSHERDIAKYLPLIPRLGKSGEDRLLLALQLTLFPGHGLTVGVTLHHAACDGSMSMLFLRTWAAFCRSALLSTKEAPPPPPSLDRTTVLADPRSHSLYAIILKSFSGSENPLPHLAGDESSSMDLVCATFTLTRDDINSLKELAMARDAANGGGNVSFHCSTIVVAYAYAWVCLVRAGGYSRDGIAHVVFAADCRARLKPPVPAGCFGNFLAPCMSKHKLDALINEEDGFVVASAAIGGAVEEFKEDPLKGAEEWMEKLKELGTKHPMSVAGAPKFKVYDIDFGWGKPAKVEVPSIGKTGAISVAESRDEEGGVEIGVILPKRQMEDFNAQFCKGLKFV
ncbi:phenolic glucoside malonyltransferase 2-like [Canna indica]|uniref:Phenolic glucoside malonyltransferase 2-like n=1 Tax=Canna indica TaxID=4628 RepID=A0AAQ3KJP0_9LILI|nr:phenolic glucoside malonyltransferase 2-like [Canna indica]WOL07413.1 phenolic glucoside malonyltransferase 2-like [Canna indica]